MNVLIEKCEVTVPRRGQQQERKRLQEEFRKTHPEIEADLESQPWYVDPDGPYGGDDCLTIHYEWMAEPNNSVRCCQSYLPLYLSDALRAVACGPVKRYTKKEFSTCEYSFPLTASFALSMLQHFGNLPPDAELVNETDVPVCCEKEEAA